MYHNLSPSHLSTHPCLLPTSWSYKYAPSGISNNACVLAGLGTRKASLDAKVCSFPFVPSSYLVVDYRSGRHFGKHPAITILPGHWIAFFSFVAGTSQSVSNGGVHLFCREHSALSLPSAHVESQQTGMASRRQRWKGWREERERERESREQAADALSLQHAV